MEFKLAAFEQDASFATLGFSFPLALPLVVLIII